MSRRFGSSVLCVNSIHTAKHKLILTRQVLDLQGGKELELDWSHVQAQFEALAASEEIAEGEAMSFDALIGGTSEVFEARTRKARAYAQRLGTDTASSPNGHTFINGKYYALDDVRRTATLSNELHLIVSGAELPELATIWYRTGTSVLPGEGYPSVPMLACVLSS